MPVSMGISAGPMRFGSYWKHPFNQSSNFQIDNGIKRQTLIRTFFLTSGRKFRLTAKIIVVHPIMHARFHTVMSFRLFPWFELTQLFGLVIVYLIGRALTSKHRFVRRVTCQFLARLYPILYPTLLWIRKRYKHEGSTT